MAKNGTKSVRVTNWDTLTFSWEISSQSVESNTSRISWNLTLYPDSDGAIASSTQKNWSVVINGVTYSGKNSVGIANNTSRVLASGTSVIAHNGAGEASITFSFRQEFSITFDGEWIGYIEGSGSATLDTIARASQPSCITWPEHTQNVGYFGDTISIHMNRKAFAFTHTVRYAYGSLKGTIATKVTTGTTWTIPLSFMDLIPNATSGSGTIYVDTYNGSVLIGTKYCGFTAKVPDSVVPTCTLTLEDITGTDDIYGSPVQHLSKIKATINPTIAYSSPIVSYQIVLDGTTYTAATATSAALKTAGDSVVTVTIKDKRGRVGSTSYTMKVQAYTSPKVTALSVHRCDADGTENEQGEYIRVLFSAEIASMSSKNTATYTLRYKKSSDVIFTEQELTALEDFYTISGANLFNGGDLHFTGRRVVTLEDPLPPGTYMLSVDCESDDTDSVYSLVSFLGGGADGANVNISVTRGTRTTKTVTLITEVTQIRFNAGHSYAESEGDTASYTNIMLNEGSTALPYEPYKAGEVILEADSSSSYDIEVEAADRHGTAARSTSASTAFTLINWGANGTSMAFGKVAEKTNTLEIALDVEFIGKVKGTIFDAIYPVGSIYMAYNHTDPSTLFGGTWTRITNRFLWATTAGGTIGLTGGEQSVTLTEEQMPVHDHGGTYTNAGTARTHAWLASGGSAMGYDSVTAGGGEAHNNMPPYIQVSIWRRTA